MHTPFANIWPSSCQRQSGWAHSYPHRYVCVHMRSIRPNEVVIGWPLLEIIKLCEQYMTGLLSSGPTKSINPTNQPPTHHDDATLKPHSNYSTDSAVTDLPRKRCSRANCSSVPNSTANGNTHCTHRPLRRPAESRSSRTNLVSLGVAICETVSVPMKRAEICIQIFYYLLLTNKHMRSMRTIGR